MTQTPKPPASPREWWIVRSPVDDAHALYLKKPSWKSIPLGHERIHVIEMAALTRANEEIADLKGMIKNIQENENVFNRNLKAELATLRAQCEIVNTENVGMHLYCDQQQVIRDRYRAALEEIKTYKSRSGTPSQESIVAREALGE